MNTKVFKKVGSLLSVAVMLGSSASIVRGQTATSPADGAIAAQSADQEIAVRPSENSARSAEADNSAATFIADVSETNVSTDSRSLSATIPVSATREVTREPATHVQVAPVEELSELATSSQLTEAQPAESDEIAQEAPGRSPSDPSAPVDQTPLTPNPEPTTPPPLTPRPTTEPGNDDLMDDNEGVFDDNEDVLDDDDDLDDDDGLFDDDDDILQPNEDAPEISPPGQTVPPDAPDEPFEVDTDVEAVRPTRSGPSYIGIGGNIGIGDGDTALGEGSFAVFSKLGLTSNISVRPSVLFSDDPTILVPLTLDFTPGVTEVTEEATEEFDVNIAPFIGAGVAITTGDDGAVDFLATGGVDVPFSERFTGTASVNVTVFDNPAVGLLLGVGYNF